MKTAQLSVGVGAAVLFLTALSAPALAAGLNGCDQIGPPGWATGPLNQLANLIWSLDGKLLPESLSIGQSLFMLLATVELGWFVVEVAVRKRGVEELIGSIGFRLISLMTMLALLNVAGQEGGQWLTDMANAGSAIGNQAVGVPSGNLAQVAVNDFQTGMQNANGVVACPFQAIMVAVNKEKQNPLQAMEALVLLAELLPMLLLCFGLWLLAVVTYVYLLFQLLIAIAEAAIVLGGGVFLLGFQGSRWTMPLSQSYWRYAVAAGMRIFSIQLVIGLSTTLMTACFTNLVSYFEGQLNYDNPVAIFTGFLPQAAMLFAVCAFVMFLARSAPKIAGSFLTGSPSIVMSDVVGAAATSAGIAALPAAAVGAGALALAGGGAAAAGGGSAAGSVGGGAGAGSGSIAGAGAGGAAGAGASPGAAATSHLNSPSSPAAEAGPKSGTPSPPAAAGATAGASAPAGGSSGGTSGGARSGPSTTPSQSSSSPLSPRRTVKRLADELVESHSAPPGGAAPDIRHSE